MGRDADGQADIHGKPLHKLADYAAVQTAKVSRGSFDPKSYVSTDNMVVNLGGVELGKTAPPSGKSTAYSKDEVLFSNIRTYFRKIWLADRKGGCSNDVLVFRVKTESVDPRFLYYTLCRADFTEHSVRTSKGAKMPRGDKAALLAFPVSFPSIAVQREIAGILGSLDDKIELNRQMNQTLEALARAVFEDWFVDFGPTRRKMAGETDPAAILGGLLPPEAAPPLAPLFPDQFGDNGLPLGWNSYALGERVIVKRGGSPRPINDFMSPSGLPWVKIADATRCHGPNLAQTREFIKPEGLSKTVLLRAGSLILSNSATPGLPKFLRLDACIHDGWLYFPETGPYSNEFLYLAFLQLRQEIVAKATGSVFNNLKTDTLKEQKVVFPGPIVLGQFDDVVLPLFQSIWANEQENQTLAATRDLLLPKLMSGELRLIQGAADD